MIGGTSPVIVFTFPNTTLPLLGSLGIPAIFPIYLDEALTGVASDGASETIRIDTQVFKNIAYQRKINQTIKINMRISKDNIIGSILLSIMSKIYELVNSQESGGLVGALDSANKEGYIISVYHDSSFMLKGYLVDFEKTPIDNQNQYSISATFSSIPAGKNVFNTVLEKVGLTIDISPR